MLPTDDLRAGDLGAASSAAARASSTLVPWSPGTGTAAAGELDAEVEAAEASSRPRIAATVMQRADDAPSPMSRISETAVDRGDPSRRPRIDELSPV